MTRRQRRRRLGDQTALAGYCMSMWDGCMCFGKKHHTGMHWCESCGDTWNNAQADEFEASLTARHSDTDTDSQRNDR